MTDSSDNAQMNVSDKMVEFKELRPCTTYTFTVAAVTMIGVGPMTTAQQVMTDKISKLGSLGMIINRQSFTNYAMSDYFPVMKHAQIHSTYTCVKFIVFPEINSI